MGEWVDARVGKTVGGTRGIEIRLRRTCVAREGREEGRIRPLAPAGFQGGGYMTAGVGTN
jgi:hypothetical protein